MAPISLSYANSFGTTLTSTGVTGAAFGFNAGQVLVRNDGAGTVYVHLGSTSAASTADASSFPLSSGETLDARGTWTAGLSIKAQSSAGASVRVGAWG